jgi:hypothetical protein
MLFNRLRLRNHIHNTMSRIRWSDCLPANILYSRIEINVANMTAGLYVNG